MKLDLIQKRFKKLGLEVVPKTTFGWTVKNPKNGMALDFSENGRGSNEVYYFVARHPDTDMSVDLNMDSYLQTVKSAISYLTHES